MQRSSRIPFDHPPAARLTSRNLVGHDPIDHFYQVVERDNWHIVWREVSVDQVPDGKGGLRKVPVPNAFLAWSQPETKLFYYDGSNDPPTVPMPDGPMRCRLL
jgi:hypothetical protein